MIAESLPPPTLISKPAITVAGQSNRFSTASGWVQMAPPTSRGAIESITYSRPSRLSLTSSTFCSAPPVMSRLTEGSSACAGGAARAATSVNAIRIAFFIVASSSPGRPAPAVRALLWEQHDLADVAALGDEFVGLAGPVERKGLGDDRIQPARLEIGQQRLGEPGRGAPPGPPPPTVSGHNT